MRIIILTKLYTGKAYKTIRDKKTKRIFTAYMNMIRSVVMIASNLPESELNRLKVKLRKPAHEILNLRIDHRKKYSERTIRNYFAVSMKSCAELKANLKLAVYNNYITSDTKRYVTRLINDIERITEELVEAHYKKKDTG
ncbi:MAG: four helix bundle protein [Ignavibacteriaceae bacterium]